jgi:hypothetical protein
MVDNTWIIIIAELCWSVFAIFALMGVVAQAYRPTHADYKATNVEFIIVTIASSGVRKSLFECIERHKSMGYKISVLLDEGSDLLPEVFWSGVNLIVVPSTYRQDLIGKGRAMNYAIEKHVGGEGWVCWIDDDNLALDDKFLYEIPYYEARGYVAMSPTITPRKGKSTMAFIMDWIRVFDGYTMYRFFTGLLKTPIPGLYGELLTVRWSVLKELGYNDRTICEDFRFASKIVGKHYNTWQSASKISIRSANSVKDLMKQRGRWFKGIAKYLKFCPPVMAIFVGLRLVMWTLGLFGSWLFVAFWFNSNFIYALPAGLCYWGIYIYGAYKANALHYIPLIPLFGIVECLSVFVGLRQHNFVVIDKN